MFNINMSNNLTPQELEDQFVISNLELSKKLYRFILDDLPKYDKYKDMTYQDKFLIIKALPEYKQFTEYFPLVVREMIFNFYHDKAFKKFVRYLFKYKPSDEDRVKLFANDKLAKMHILNKKNAKYLYFLHYYRTNKRSKTKSEEYYNTCLKELDNDAKKHYDDYLEQLKKSDDEKQKIASIYKEEIIKELKN